MKNALRDLAGQTSETDEQDMHKIQRFVFPISAAVLISTLTITALLMLTPGIWADWRPATCLGTGCFCESANEQSPIRQTSNTYSSLVFVISGMLILSHPSRNLVSRRLPAGYSYLMGIASVIVGIGSAFYHASLTFIGQFFDVFGMFLLAAFMLVYAWERIYKLQSRTTLALYLIINTGLAWLQIAVPDTRRYVFAIVLIVALIFEHYFRLTDDPRIDVRWMRIGLGLLAGAFIIWILDNTRIVCFENSLLQGHAVWHLLGAAAVLFLHRYYVSEVTN